MYIKILKISPTEESYLANPDSIDGISSNSNRPDTISLLLECVEVPTLPIRDQELQLEGFEGIDSAVVFRVHQVCQHIKFASPNKTLRGTLVSYHQEQYIDATVWVR